MTAPSSAPAARQRGLGLLEILIAVVLLSVGLLAASNMQAQSLHSSRSAYYRSQAYFMATDMIDRIRANAAAAAAGAYDGAATSAEAVDPSCAARRCDGADIALRDVRHWSSRLHRFGRGDDFVPLLPSAGEIDAGGAVTRLAESIHRVTVSWAEPEGPGHRRESLTMDFATEIRE